MATRSDIRQFMLGQAFGKTFIPKDADFSGKTVVVTGANSGIGFECAKHLARLKASQIILGCRSVEKGDTAKNAISRDVPDMVGKIEVWQLDLAIYTSVLAFSERVQNTLPRLDAFIANAGVELVEFSLSEGVETTINVNVISSMLLNIAMLPKLRETSKKYGAPTHLTIVGSSVHIFGSADTLKPAQGDKGMDTFERLSDPTTSDMGSPLEDMSPRYALSKTVLHAVSQELAKRASKSAKERVIANWVNPGWCASDLSRAKSAPNLRQRIFFSLIGRTAEQGSRELVHGVLSGQESHGHYMSECCVKPESKYLRSEQGTEVRERLWRELMGRIRNISPEIADIVEK